MNLLSFFGVLSTSGHDPIHNFWYGPVGRKTAAGVNVDDSTAMTYSACRAATMLLCTSGGMIPLKLFDQLASGGSQAMKDDPRYGMVHDTPNDDMTSMMYRCWGMNQQINRGNWYSEVERNGAGMPVKLWPIHASRIPRQNILRGQDGRIFYRVRNNDGTTTDIKHTDMLHIPSPITEDGIVGVGVVEHACLSIGLGIATETQGAAFFGNSARPTIVITGGKFKDKADREDYRRQWVEVHGGPENNGKPAMLPEGSELKALSFNAQESQFLETRQHNIEEIARWYGVPPHMIGHLLRSTNNNITQQSLEFVKYSLMRWIVVAEQEMSRKLLTPEERKTKFFKFVVEGLERADITTRTAALKDQFFNGEITLNEWRALEDRNPIGPLGDLHFVQGAMVPLEIAAKGPQPPPTGRPPQDEPDSEPPPEPPADDEPEDSDLATKLGELLATHQQSTVQLIADLRAELTTRVDVPTVAELDAVKAAQQTLAASMLRDVMSRMISLEVNAVKRCADKPEKFGSRVNEFYDKHAATLERELLSPITACLIANGDAREPAGVVSALAAAHVSESVKQIDALCKLPEAERGAAAEACVAGWHERAVTL